MAKHLTSIDSDGLEALEYTQRFANDTGIDVAESRPCVAQLFYEGVAGGGTGRKPGAFIVALELKVAGLPPIAISKHLEVYGGRCSPPLQKNVLAAVLRGIKPDRYDKRHGCDKLQAYCVGEDICPFKTKSGASLSQRQQSGPTAFVSLGWVGYLSGSMAKIYIALMDLRVKKGLDPDTLFIFDFSELERRSGVSRSSLHDNLEKLEKVGLVDTLNIGTKWGSEKRLRTEVRLASPIPSPTKMGLRPLRARDEDF